MKYALVTGASSGIGWHISKELAQRGYSLVAVSNQAESLKELKKELERQYSIAVVTLNLDLAGAESAKEVFDFCEKNKIEIKVLVNNAGILIAAEVVKVDYPQASAILQLHVTTPALLCHLFGQKMSFNNKGHILNVSSISAVMPYPTISFYGPTKTFLRYFTRAFRTEMSTQKVNVTCLLPGATATALYDTQAINIPLGMKLGIMKKPEDVARAGVKALFAGRAECIPGVLNKLLVWLLPFVPYKIIQWIYRFKVSEK